MKSPTYSRRRFLRCATTASAVAGFATIVPASILGAQAPSKSLAVAAIGAGGRGSDILYSAASHPNVKMVAVCDVFKSRREHTAQALNQRYGGTVCTPYRDLREMLARDDIDAVTIGTPDHWHVPAALLAIRSGKDVYVEKPLGISMEEIQTIRREVNRYGRIFQ